MELLDSKDNMSKGRKFCKEVIWFLTDVRSIVSFILILGVSAVFLSLLLNEVGESDDCRLPSDIRIDCMPDHTKPNATFCVQQRKCCFDKEAKEDIPDCYHRPNSEQYKYVCAKTVCELQDNISASIDLYQQLHVCCSRINNGTVRIMIRPNATQNFNVGKEYYRIPTEECSDLICVSQNYNVTIDKAQLTINVYRLGSSSTLLFSTRYGPLIFSKEYVETTVILPSRNLYGLGQGHHSSFRHDMSTPKVIPLVSRYGLWNGTRPRTKLSDINSTSSVWPGVHPFYLVIEEDGYAHGVLLLNFYPMEVTTNNLPAITFRSSGGILDFYIFLGPRPLDVVSNLTDIVGRPYMPPYWALGHHTCRRDGNTTYGMEIVEKMKDSGIPHESDCGIDSLLRNQHINNSTKEFVAYLRNHSRRFNAVFFPHVSLSTEPKDSIPLIYNFLKDAPYKGIVDNEEVAYPDFFANNMSWLTEKYRAIKKDLMFDGVILDRNTPEDFRNASHCSKKINSMKFQPGGRYLSDGTVCMDAKHESNADHLTLHNMYGYRHLAVSSESLKNLTNNKRAFLASLSTFIGSGQYGGHWGGQYVSSWEMLKQSVIQMLEFNMYGVPLSGAPTCGFIGEFDEDLCTRWIQVAAFQPLMISYRNDSQSVVLLKDLASTARVMLQLRYSLLPYLYTLFYRAHLFGEMVVRPLAFEFPKDKEARGIDDQFLWGPALLVSPVLMKNSQQVHAYFPSGRWFNLFNGKPEGSDKSQWSDLSAFEYQINLHVREGHVIPLQQSGTSTTTTDSRNKYFRFIIALKCNRNAPDFCRAKGELFVDDGESEVKNGTYLLVSVTAENSTVTIMPRSSFTPGSGISTILNTIEIFGLRTTPKSVIVDEKIIENKNKIFDPLKLTITDLFLNITIKHILYWTN